MRILECPRTSHVRLITETPDAIQGGTWEAFERILKRRGYFKTGLRKVEAARAIASYSEPTRNTSQSFANFFHAIIEVTS